MRKNNLMTTGEIAKKMNVSVRTVQYYDKIGLLTPSEISEGGRRLYSFKDYMTLHQIVSLKELGFTLKEIKERVIPSNGVEEIDEYLKQQETRIENEIKKLNARCEIIKKFRHEMMFVKDLDWEMLVEILSLLRNEDENFWVVKHFDKETYSKIKDRFRDDEGKKYMRYMQSLCEEATVLKRENTSYYDRKSIDFAERWWGKIMEFTGGDIKMLQQMTQMTDEGSFENSEFMNTYKEAEDYISEVLTYCFEKNILVFPTVKEDKEGDKS